jgi:uncharacterized protein YndB with AHSA1/START domain
MIDPSVARVRRRMPAPPAVVFDEWLDPDSMIRWMFPHPARCLAAKLEARVGGMLRFDVDDGGSRPVITGHFLVLDRPVAGCGRLRFTWSCSTWIDPTVQSVVTVSVDRADADPTVLTIEHSLLPPNLVNAHELGWTQIADQLADMLAEP